MKILYIDTNIFLNVLFAEDKFADASMRLLNSIEEERYSAVTSLLTLMEIHRVLQKRRKRELEIKNAIRNILNLSLKVIVPESADMVVAYQLIKELRIDPADSIHVALAKEVADIFISRDKYLVSKIKSVITTKNPEELM